MKIREVLIKKFWVIFLNIPHKKFLKESREKIVEESWRSSWFSLENNPWNNPEIQGETIEEVPGEINEGIYENSLWKIMNESQEESLEETWEKSIKNSQDKFWKKIFLRHAIDFEILWIKFKNKMQLYSQYVRCLHSPINCFEYCRKRHINWTNCFWDIVFCKGPSKSKGTVKTVNNVDANCPFWSALSLGTIKNNPL